MINNLFIMRLYLPFDISLMGRNRFSLDLHAVGNLNSVMARHPHAQHIGLGLAQSYGIEV